MNKTVQLCVMLAWFCSVNCMASDRPPRETGMAKDYNACLATTTPIVLAGLGLVGGKGVQITLALFGIFLELDGGIGKCTCMLRHIQYPGGYYRSRMVCTVTTEHLCGELGHRPCCWYAGETFECSGGGGGGQ
jgi:hypothetical protein